MSKFAKIAGLMVLALFAVSAFAQTNTLDQVNVDPRTIHPGVNVGPGSYLLNYYSNVQRGADSFVRIVNPGTNGTPLDSNEGIVCANIYVFDSTQEMMECCSCELTANDITVFNVKTNLLNAPLTGSPGPNNGVVKIVADAAGSRCDARDVNPLFGYLGYQLLAWGTHLQESSPSVLSTTETAYEPAYLDSRELEFLETACQFVQFLGSGRGVCTCPTDLPGHQGG